MAAPSAGTIVLVRFPFSDLSRSKLRPAMTLADVGRGDALLCQITSRGYSDPRAVELNEDSFAAGSLHRTSYVRPGKLFTAHESLVERAVGRLKPEAHQAVVESVVNLIRRSSPQR